VKGLLAHLVTVPGWAVIAIVGALVFAEDALFVGFVLPGETAAILGGVSAKLGHVPLAGVVTTVIIAAIVGDSVGYEIGHHFGPRILHVRILQRRRQRLKDAQDLLARRGGSAVFLGRWIAFFRAVMPALAGIAGMRYPKFLVFNAAGGIAWGTLAVMLGYAAGASYTTVESTLGRGSAIAALAIVLLAVVAWRIHRHRASSQRRPEEPPG
jgi:membrane-associated protein